MTFREGASNGHSHSHSMLLPVIQDPYGSVGHGHGHGGVGGGEGEGYSSSPPGSQNREQEQARLQLPPLQMSSQDQVERLL